MDDLELASLYKSEWEFNNPIKDIYGRNRRFSSPHKNFFSPEVSSKLFKEGFVPHYPGNKEFAVCISHDIDILYKTSTTHVQPSIAKRITARAANLVGINYKPHGKHIELREPNKEWSLERLRKLNDGYGIKSSYYFLSLGHNEEDFNYSLAEVKEQMENLIASGCELGLHGGHKAYNDAGKLLEEKTKFNKETGLSINGYRNHYLRFDVPATWYNVASAGFEYDTTFGYPDSAGFRNGMCYPYYPYDIATGKFINVIELPLILMEMSLFNYMRLDIDTALSLCKKLINEIKACKGVFTVLWHNSSLDGQMGELYIKLLDLLKEEDPWFATSADIVKWWKEEHLLEQSHTMVKKLLDV